MKPTQKILIILSRVPWPLEKGDKLRAYHQIKYLSKNYNITLCCLHDTPIHPDARKELLPFCEELHFFKLSSIGILLNITRAFLTGLPLQTGYFYNSRIHKKIKGLYKQQKHELVYCQLIRTARYAFNMPCKRVLDYQDVFSEGMNRQAHSAKGWRKLLYKIEYKRLLGFEPLCFDRFHVKTIISAPDRELIPHQRKEEIHIIPNGIDTIFFKPIAAIKDINILFTGNMNYPPNILAAEFLAKEIVPMLLGKYPNIKVMLAGANPHQRVKALADKNIEVTGWVADMRDCYKRSRIFIAPMTIGTGLQNKLLEAMSMQLPCITSPLANDALGAQHLKNILVASSVNEFVQHTLMLLEDWPMAEALGISGHIFVKENFSWEKAGLALEDLLSQKQE